MKRLITIATLLVAAGWGVYVVAGTTLSNLLATRLGGLVLKLGEGKISSPAEFLQHRMFEAAWLATLLLGWGWLHVAWARSRFNRSVPPRWAWALPAGIALVCFNLWLGQASRTVLFWGLMWDGKETQNLARFHIKLILAREDHSARRVLLIGSSQVRAQIDEEALNSLLGSKVRATETHFPGARAYDHFLMQPVMAQAGTDCLVLYLSEAYFHTGSTSEVVPNFFTLGALPDLARRGGLKYVPAGRIGYGLLGQALPMFRLREVLAQRLFGPAMGQLEQKKYNTQLLTNLKERGAGLAKSYELNDESRFQKRALEDFLVRSRDSNQRVILLAGQLNPILSRQMDAQIRREMIALLRSLAAKFPHVTLVEELPEQMEQDYDDITHVNKPAQERFTRFLAGWLEQNPAAIAPLPRQ